METPVKEHRFGQEAPIHGPFEEENSAQLKSPAEVGPWTDGEEFNGKAKLKKYFKKSSKKIKFFKKFYLNHCTNKQQPDCIKEAVAEQ